jgi:hypothetical protein
MAEDELEPAIGIVRVMAGLKVPNKPEVPDAGDEIGQVRRVDFSPRLPGIRIEVVNLALLNPARAVIR